MKLKEYQDVNDMKISSNFHLLLLFDPDESLISSFTLLFFFPTHNTTINLNLSPVLSSLLKIQKPQDIHFVTNQRTSQFNKTL